MPQPTSHWIAAGRPLRAAPHHTAGQADDLLHRHGLVRVTTGPDGTEIRWSTASPSMASLFYVAEWVADLSPPFMLRFFHAGWFEEVLDDAATVRDRISAIISRSDVHLLRRAYVKECNPATTRLPPLLRETLDEGIVPADYAIDCQFCRSAGQFRVTRIGTKSAIARLWGLAPVSYPCRLGGGYDQAVSAAYADVLKTGRTRYDHVYAAMHTPSATVVWIPYHRLISPVRQTHASDAVQVVSAIAKVDIEVI